MRINRLVPGLALLAMTGMVVPSYAADENINKSITVNDTVSVGSTQLKPGDYRVKVDGTKVTIEFHNKVVATAEGKWEPRNERFDSTAIIYDANHQIQEIRFSGHKNALVLTAGSATTGSQK
jgi:hypothetical protein